MAEKIASSQPGRSVKRKNLTQSSSSNNFKKATDTVKDNTVKAPPIITISQLQSQIDELREEIASSTGVDSWIALTGNINLAQAYVALLAGQANGLATLDGSGQIPSSQLPYDLMEFMEG